MQINRRNFLTLAGGVAAATTLTSCAGTGSAPVQKGEEGVIKFWSNHPGKSKEIEQKLIDAFVAANPGTKVELVDAGANYEEVAQKFNAALTGGDLPDVLVASDVTWFNFALNKAITPLDELWSQVGVKADDYIDTLREDYTFNGKHYAMPYARSTCLFYYNKDMWAKAGLEDRGPTTWQEFDQFASKLQQANGNVAPLTVSNGTNYLDWYFQGMIWTFGGKYSDKWDMKFSSPQSLEAGKFLASMSKANKIKVTKDPTNEFGTGLSAALLESTGSLGGLIKQAKVNFGTAYLPGPKPGCPTGGAGLAVPANISDERKKLAVKFIDFITNAQNTATFTQATGYMPVRKSAMQDPSEQKYLQGEPRAMTAIKQLQENTGPQDYARVFVPGGGRRIGEGLDKITTGGQDVAAVFAQLDEDSRKTYERDIKPKL
ncbi:ABC transporter substrate-binding protein [Enemella dayhoffiae]|uniref:ABC transporter substrate-binding protein n=1 Tax=Enemella dayhoffiae TaxID=2016507 RepID=A0A255GVH8_9ACTN|nr:ABC transporter substrate-binding protein [Enemella dayhoffiae]OYO17234.1 ABC transporter substrate-binding protein [Enemella dayhoffiae]